ncbi:hypothetical protein BX616_006323, partial [Lobosporangium transversale]
MHLRSLFISATVAGITAAQSAPSALPPSPMSPAPTSTPAPGAHNKECAECLRKNIQSISNCASYSEVPGSNATDSGAKRCFCALASSFHWLTSCQNDQSGCPAAYVELSMDAYNKTKGAMCANVDME